jgi:Protein of unknown function (DUF4229)
VTVWPLPGLCFEAAGLSSIVVVAPHTPRIPVRGTTLARDVALYTAARLALVAALTLLLVLAGVPLPVSILLALVVALPLSMVLLGSLRSRVNAGLEVVGRRRRVERDRLRRQLRGE